jgi:proline dehydrogenase
LEDCQDAIDHLHENRTLTILDYGAEGKTSEEDFDQTIEENIKAILFASTHPSVPVISTKVTALASNELLEKVQSNIPLSEQESKDFEKVKQRLHQLCRTAKNYNVSVFIDAEETWMQDTIDRLVKELMEKYNREKVVVYHTYQLYRKDKLAGLIADHHEAKQKGYKLGAKIVRGAYMEKERNRAQTMNYATPIQETKDDTDNDFNTAIKYCVDHYEEIGSCNGSHNLKSNQYEAELIASKGLQRNHSHLNFCQLYGMSDYITFNLAEAGYNVAKYVPYGPVKEVVPYLIRRARENTSVTGEMSRELSLILAEMKRRGMK